MCRIRHAFSGITLTSKYTFLVLFSTITKTNSQNRFRFCISLSFFSFCSAWSEDGCYVESTNRSHTICMCNHLTNFAILMDLVDDTSQSLLSIFDDNLRIMVYVSIAICIIFIVIAFLTLRLFNGVFLKVRNRSGSSHVQTTTTTTLSRQLNNNCVSSDSINYTSSFHHHHHHHHHHHNHTQQQQQPPPPPQHRQIQMLNNYTVRMGGTGTRLDDVDVRNFSV